MFDGPGEVKRGSWTLGRKGRDGGGPHLGRRSPVVTWEQALVHGAALSSDWLAGIAGWDGSLWCLVFRLIFTWGESPAGAATGCCCLLQWSSLEPAQRTADAKLQLVSSALDAV